MAFSLTVTLDVAGRRAVVVGGGHEAVARVGALLHGDAEVVVVTPDPDPELTAHAAAGRIVLERRGWQPGDLVGAFVAYVTREDDTPVEATWAEATEHRVLLSTLDDIPRCHFATPSIVRRGDLAITIATAGRAPALAKRLRRKLEVELGEVYAELVDVLDEARQACLPRPVPFPEWAARWERALEDLDGLVALVDHGHRDEARDRVITALRTPTGAGAT
ncbi:bifunctional precorrin-2 dehydrogenase/sirohydrochlorin ferrochelatase [Nitriliruptoraceae bacterium ZYF776]|nr:bifunctional precorrin-2 dehydrogenase/sirohydrochlorin ferrochelatase [Profundirhabdus halotolerans]